MKRHNILVTGGAGFIGSFLTDKLIALGHSVIVLDNLEPQVHQGKKPSYLNKKAKYIFGDVRDYKSFKKALKGVDSVIHLAARVGVQQSNYEITEYIDANIKGMANLLDIVVNEKLPIKKIIMTASMTSYGEGDYRCSTHGIVKPSLRQSEQLLKGDFDVHCPKCKKIMSPQPTTESSLTINNSIYALTKNVQEELLLRVGRMYAIPVVSLRCFNVYGPRQSLSNPYTGVSAIFISRLKNNKQPIVYEDGLQSRDFISVHDVVDAIIKALDNSKADYKVLNIGSGKPTSIKEIAEVLSNLLGKNISPAISGKFRKDDIRHCYADNTNARKILQWKPTVSLKEGLRELIEWSQSEEATDTFEQAERELKKKSLL